MVPMHHASPILVRGVTTRPDRRMDSRLRGNDGISGKDGIGGLPDFFSSLLASFRPLATTAMFAAGFLVATVLVIT